MTPFQKNIQTYLQHSSDWNEVETFEEKVFVGDLELYSLGLAVQNSDGITVTGSAVDPYDYPILRAYGELIERVSIIDFIKSHPDSKTIFPKSTNPAYSYAKSNGVAAHSDQKLALQSAHSELYERDALLRSWLGNGYCQRMDDADMSDEFEIIERLKKNYHWEIRIFLEAPVFVVGCFGFPHHEKENQIKNHAYGFGAGGSRTEALQKAVRETLQSLAFLYDETFNYDANRYKKNPPIPSPGLHQEYWYSPQLGRNSLKTWINHFQTNFPKSQISEESLNSIELTPKTLQDCLSVVKVSSVEALPLVFGWYDYEAMHANLLMEKHPSSNSDSPLLHPIP